MGTPTGGVRKAGVLSLGASVPSNGVYTGLRQAGTRRVHSGDVPSQPLSQGSGGVRELGGNPELSSARVFVVWNFR